MYVSLYMYVCSVCVYTYIYIYIYIYTHTHTYIERCTHTFASCSRASTRLSTCAFNLSKVALLSTYIHAIHTHIRIYIHTYTRPTQYIQYKHTIHTCIHTYIHTFASCSRASTRLSTCAFNLSKVALLSTYTHTIHTCMHTYIHTYTPLRPVLVLSLGSQLVLSVYL